MLHNITKGIAIAAPSSSSARRCRLLLSWRSLQESGRSSAYGAANLPMRWCNGRRWRGIRSRRDSSGHREVVSIWRCADRDRADGDDQGRMTTPIIVGFAGGPPGPSLLGNFSKPPTRPS